MQFFTIALTTLAATTAGLVRGAVVPGGATVLVEFGNLAVGFIPTPVPYNSSITVKWEGGSGPYTLGASFFNSTTGEIDANRTITGPTTNTSFTVTALWNTTDIIRFTVVDPTGSANSNNFTIGGFGNNYTAPSFTSSSNIAARQHSPILPRQAAITSAVGAASSAIAGASSRVSGAVASGAGASSAFASGISSAASARPSAAANASASYYYYSSLLKAESAELGSILSAGGSSLAPGASASAASLSVAIGSLTHQLASASASASASARASTSTGNTSAGFQNIAAPIATLIVAVATVAFVL